MDIYYGTGFYEFAQREQQLKELLNRALKKGILTSSGAEYLRTLK